MDPDDATVRARQRDLDSYLRWFQAARLMPLWHRYIPEGASGHTLVLARAS